MPEMLVSAGRAVVYLRTYDALGKQVGLGSGFLVEKGRVVTNAHVLEGAARVEVYDFEDNIVGTADYAESLSHRIDLAVLPSMANVPGVLRLADKEPLVGDGVIVIGAPQGLTNTVSTGIVSAFRSHNGRRWMQISAPISQGSSGGPVMNRKGDVVGVSVAVLRDGQNLNFAVPGRDVRALLGSPPGRVPLHVAVVGGLEPEKANVPATVVSEPAPKLSLRELFLQQPRLTIGEPHVGSLDERDVLSDSGKRLDVLVAEGGVGDVYTAFGFSNSFEVALAAFGIGADGGAEQIGQDVEKVEGNGARLVVRVKRNGLFGIMVSSGKAGEKGEYRLGLFRGDVNLPEKKGGSEQGRWMEVAEAKGRVIYIDRTTLRKMSPSKVRAWVWERYSQWQSGVNGRYDNVKSLCEFDCAERSTRYRSITYYADGDVTHSNAEIGDWIPWMPGSVGEGMGVSACEHAL
ncbi:trypsin-like peptidase domain-containing protein [Myxococcus xanthus]|nr:trypsin-like peptidase domain-containing protein [Myxococcus xanthus]